MDAGPFHVLPDDAAAHHMLGDDVRNTLGVHPIIQSSCTSRTWERCKPAAQSWHHLGGEDLSYQNVRALGAAPEAALPHQLGVLFRTVRFQHRSAGFMEDGRSMAVAALGATTDQDLEAPSHRLQSVTGTRQHVNRALVGHDNVSAARWIR
jgi:hypothetical protein